MRIHMRRVLLTVAATILAAACGDDGGSARSTAIPTPTATATPDEPPGGGLILTIATLPGSDVDAGWTGLWHNSVATHDTVVTTNLDCIIDDCVVDGSDLVGRAFGVPLPLSAGGVSVCVHNSFREAVTGTYNGDNGCSESSVKLSSRVFLVEDAERPCPPCIGDPTPNDGVKGGTCRGGTTPGAACDVGGNGMTSNDCPPTGSSVGDLHIDLSPLTTGTVTVHANVDCRSDTVPAGSCHCPNQMQPNACEPDGLCPASGVCELGPIDSVCEAQPFRPCRSGTGAKDCDAVFPGAGRCVDQPRPCFGTTVTRTGTCGTQQSTLVSFFCIPRTTAAVLDMAAGLPGPGAIVLPVHQVRALR